MVELKLQQATWILAEQINGGAFGRVFAAKSADCDAAVAKLVPKAAGAERELLFADLTGVRNVIPIIDQGETDDSWVLVMPRAEQSLRQHLVDNIGPLGLAEAVAVLTDIATALVDLDSLIVHRDLKPENILLLNGNWCLADFGISRYAEATTAADTRKFMLTPPYAAPEQWRSEHAMTAADVYAFGVIAHELLSGTRPFPGPEGHNFRDQHLHSSPPQLTGVPPVLGALVEECLYKAAEARPAPANILARLAQALSPPPSGGLAQLQNANHENAARRGEAARQASVAQSASERREALAGAARQSLARIADSMRDAVVQAAPTASLSVGLEIGWTAQLMGAELRFAPPTNNRPDKWGAWTPPAFDVIAFTELSVRIPPNRYGYEGRSHSLWYCDAQEAGKYQWSETAFMVSPLIPRQGRQDPFALDPGEESAKALWQGAAEWQVAWPFTPIVVGMLDDFISRWAGWFAAASTGQLNRPSVMPERSPQGSWRQT